MAPTIDVAAWLKELGLDHYEAAFRDNAVDGEVLSHLTDADLQQLGVLLGHRKKMLAAIARLRDEAGPSPPSKPELVIADGELRQVTVLFADIAGYSALNNELGAEQMHGLLGRFFSKVDLVIRDHGGHVDKHIGDCVMAVFGAPLAYGNDAERAVRAALAIRAVMANEAMTTSRLLEVHIGIATGEVIASGTGSDIHREYTVTGETVNLAARLTDKARAGEILVSDGVLRALGPKLRCGDVGELVVKGFALPVQAFRLEAYDADADDTLVPLVGRDRELQQFSALLAGCRQGSEGCCLYVRGEAGVGKTRLVREFEREALASGVSCHVGLVLDFGVAIDAIRALVRSLLGLSQSSSIDARAQAARSAVEQRLISADDLVFLNDLLDVPQTADLRGLYDAMDNTTRSQGRQRLLANLVKALSQRRPCMLVVEDIHWADRSTLQSVATLAKAVSESPAILVMTSRVDGDPIDNQWRADAASLITVDLGALRARDALAFARSLIDAEDRVIERLVARAEGNPFFLEQLLRHSLHDTEEGVPGSIQPLVQARIDKLEPMAKRALQAASVLGQSFSLDALRHLLDDPAVDCSDLVAKALVKPMGQQYLFAHALIRDAVYASLLRARRRELHAKAASWYPSRDPTLLAEHLERAESPEAPAAYGDAAERQANLYRYEQALELTARGLNLAKTADDTVRLRQLRATILREIGKPQEAMAAFRELAGMAADDAAQCRAWVGVASCDRLLGSSDAGLAALGHAAPIAQRLKLQRELSEINYYLGSLAFSAGHIEKCLAHYSRAREFAVAIQDGECEARALSGLGDIHYGRGEMRLAIEYFKRCRALSQKHGYGRVEAGSIFMIGAIRRYLSEHEAALNDLRNATVRASAVNNFRTRMTALTIFGELLVDAARSGEAHEALLEASRLADRFNNQRYGSYILYELGRCCYYAPGRREEARAYLDKALAFGRRVDRSFVTPRALATLALVDDAQRLSALAEGMSILEAGCLAHNVLWFYRDAIEAHLKAGDLEQAKGCATMLERHTRQDPLPWSQFIIERGRSLAEYAEGRRDHALFEKLANLRGDGERAGLNIALPAITAALAGHDFADVRAVL